MKTELADIPFDHFQRYASAARLVRALTPEQATVLEVGANRQRLLGEFLPDYRLLYSDLEPQEGPDFVVADACALPFPDRGFDAVVSLDVLEHIPAPQRQAAVFEMARVAARSVVLCCPTDRPWVHEAERQANGIWERHMGGAYPWLAEHQECGLVDPEEVERAFHAAGLRTVRIGQGDPVLWSTLMGAHFAKEAVPELAPLVAALDSFYNRVVFASDSGERGYRDIFIGVREEAELERVMHVPASDSPQDMQASALLMAIAGALHPVVSRVLRAEQEWRQTAAQLAETERRLQQEHERHHRVGLALAAAEARAAEQFERANRADDKTRVLDEMLQAAEARAAEQFDRGNILEQELEASERRAVEQLNRADAADRKLLQLEGEFAVARQHVESLELELANANEHRASLNRVREELQGHVARLATRVAGLERRQRWAIASAAFAAVVGSAFYLAAT